MHSPITTRQHGFHIEMDLLYAASLVCRQYILLNWQFFSCCVLHGFGTRKNPLPLQVRDCIDHIVTGIVYLAKLIKIILLF
jgi:hypothetical protein